MAGIGMPSDKWDPVFHKIHQEIMNLKDEYSELNHFQGIVRNKEACQETH